MALQYSQTPVELREVILRDKPREFITASAKATVPVLILPDGRVIDQSYDIMNWALARGDPDGWLDIDRAVGDALIDRNDFEFKPSLDQYKYPERYPRQSGEAGRDLGMVFLRRLEELCQERPYLFGECVSIVDVAVAPFVRQYAHVDPAWFESAAGPALNGWLERFEQSELFLSVMQKYPRWSPGDDMIVFAAGSVP
jgi:glutathione S-transferase